MTQEHFLQHIFGKPILVPNTSKDITIGSTVEWLVDRRRADKHPPFYATGRVVKLYMTTFGGSKRKSAAKVRTNDRYLTVYPGRIHTTVALDKLKLVE